MYSTQPFSALAAWDDGVEALPVHKRLSDDSRGGEFGDDLGDDDPWVRFNAHTALIVIAGQKNFGYHYQGTARERSDAQKRWREWWKVSEELRAEDAASGS